MAGNMPGNPWTIRSSGLGGGCVLYLTCDGVSFLSEHSDMATLVTGRHARVRLKT